MAVICKGMGELPGYPFVDATDRIYYYWAPHFNPNNPNQFACMRGDGALQTVSIITYDFQTNAVTSLYSHPSIWNAPKWGKNNWLVFGQGSLIYKIKSNGDSLTQLTFGGGQYYPVWNYDASKIAYHSNNPVNESLEISNTDGILEERIESTVTKGLDWSMDNHIIATGTGRKLVLINDSTYSKTTIDANNHTDNYGICWLDKETLFWTANNSIYRMNIITQEKTLIKIGCDTKTYISVSISSDKQKLIAQTVEFAVNRDNRTLESRNGIYLMNIDGSNEVALELPKY